MISDKEYKAHKEDYWLGKHVVLLRKMTTKGGVIFPKGMIMKIDRKYSGFNLITITRCPLCEINIRHSIWRVSGWDLELYDGPLPDYKHKGEQLDRESAAKDDVVTAAKALLKGTRYQLINDVRAHIIRDDELVREFEAALAALEQVRDGA